MERLMKNQLLHLDQYLVNMQVLLKSLLNDDLEEINKCLDKNRIIMKGYDQRELITAESQRNDLVRNRMETIRQINQQCLLQAEKRCQTLRNEIENINKNRNGIRKYGVKQTQNPKFIDHNI
jgi:hypothetical protein